MPPKERQITDDVIRWLRASGHYAVKVHGEAMQERGLPDILCCIDGVFCAIEMKRQRGEEPTPLQRYQLECIDRAGGKTLVAYSLEDVRCWVDLREQSQPEEIDASF